jgi:hypothetical protein
LYVQSSEDSWRAMSVYFPFALRERVRGQGCSFVVAFIIELYVISLRRSTPHPRPLSRGARGAGEDESASPDLSSGFVMIESAVCIRERAGERVCRNP